ncbi:MAG: CinA family nicotinamide mononucleotide deamidase-related protein [Pirellulales bacterium]
MIAEVISIGDELTSGQRLDTNSQWLSTQLADLGVRTAYHTTVTDDLDANIAVFRAAIRRVNIVVVTGGLGPTADDLTRQALAAAADRPLRYDFQAIETIRALFSKRGRKMPGRNHLQALFPDGSLVIPNPHGTAPGIDLLVQRPKGGPARVFCLPGVPSEMREMWHAGVAPMIRTMLGKPTVIRHRVLKCFGKGESELEAMLPDLIRRGREPLVGITASGATLSLRITALGDTAEAANRSMVPTVETICGLLGDLVYGEGDDELQDAVARSLRDEGAKIATAECATQGLVAQAFRALTDTENVFLGGVVVADDRALVDFLGDAAAVEEADQETLCRAAAERAHAVAGELRFGDRRGACRVGRDAAHLAGLVDRRKNDLDRASVRRSSRLGRRARRQAGDQSGAAGATQTRNELMPSVADSLGEL